MVVVLLRHDVLFPRQDVLFCLVMMSFFAPSGCPFNASSRYPSAASSGCLSFPSSGCPSGVSSGCPFLPRQDVFLVPRQDVLLLSSQDVFFCLVRMSFFCLVRMSFGLVRMSVSMNGEKTSERCRCTPRPSDALCNFAFPPPVTFDGSQDDPSVALPTLRLRNIFFSFCILVDS